MDRYDRYDIHQMISDCKTTHYAEVAYNTIDITVLIVYRCIYLYNYPTHPLLSTYYDTSS